MGNRTIRQGTAAHAAWAAGLSALFCAPLVLGFLGPLHPAFDLFAHFRWHLAILLAGAALYSLAAGARGIGAVALAAAAAAFATTAGFAGMPFSGPERAAASAPDGSRPVYRLLQLNLRYDNAEPERALSLIGRVRPDIVTLTEVSPMWAQKLALIRAAYPEQNVCASMVPIGGSAVLARRPFLAGAACLDRGTFALAHIDLNGSGIDVAALHLGWPWPLDQWWQIGNLAAPMRALGDSAIVGGDFNAVAWSAAVDAMASPAGFRLAAIAGGTWLHRFLPTALRKPFGLGIDHVLVKGGIRVHSATTLEDVGSDHAPVLVEFSLAPQEGERPAETLRAAAPYIFG